LFYGKFFDQEGDIHEIYEGRDSALAALKQAVDKYFGPIRIHSHKSQSDGETINAESISTIVISDSSQELFEGIGVDQDIEISAMKAFIDAVNKAFVDQNFRIASGLDE
jgi:2-isopropylmalate synthase